MLNSILYYTLPIHGAFTSLSLLSQGNLFSVLIDTVRRDIASHIIPYQSDDPDLTSFFSSVESRGEYSYFPHLRVTTVVSMDGSLGLRH